MAHVKSGGSAKRTVDVAGKRLGVKKFGGEAVKPGDIIIRQRGTKTHPGVNTGMGKDHTIFSKINGFVSFRRLTGHKRGKNIVDVLLEVPAKKEEVKVSTTKSSAKAKTTKAPKSAK
ncbi:50S ribosomal protein L27 [Candidatus Dojkabacteria bacterium]|uniref:Large ribosomal subunit protein bL27 n=1 Tax=Candidatus Dojkabacteria bacterium TaxID=2099670 RepID=A0A955LA48_9BACT|nr:50S ribosomal protein L27 [Candidatus Dojkabacteria bacterium]